jgi:hypothetical protein
MRAEVVWQMNRSCLKPSPVNLAISFGMNARCLIPTEGKYRSSLARFCL